MTQLPERYARYQKLGDATSYVETIYSLLDTIRLFEDLTREEVADLCKYMLTFKVATGWDVIAEGEQGDFMILIIEGTLDIVKRNAQDVEERVTSVGPGKSLGEMAVIDGGPRFASCVTSSDVIFAVLGRAELNTLMTEKPSVAVKLLMQIASMLNQRLRDVSNRLIRTHTSAGNMRITDPS